MVNTDVIIIGGGLAGLTAAIHLARKNVKTLLFEKEEYPHHKVCGEYLSKEIIPYLEQLQIPIQDLEAPNISRLIFSTASGKAVETKLPLGGIGVSRYALDHLFYKTALQAGVTLIQEAVTGIEFSEDEFKLSTNTDNYSSTYVFGAFGKRSSVDKILDRRFFKKSSPWLAVKTHYLQPDFPDDLVALHNFYGGYCGLSSTESDKINVCYLATYKSFKLYKNTQDYEREILQSNPYLKEFFSRSTPVFEQPLTIAQVSFDEKAPVVNHILMLGDAAGLIHPLCGNGMAMAIHSAKIASELVFKQMQNPQIPRIQMEIEYARHWNLTFRSRMKTGRFLQKILLSPQAASFSQQLVSRIPFILPQIIKRTHGQPLL